MSDVYADMLMTREWAGQGQPRSGSAFSATAAVEDQMQRLQRQQLAQQQHLHQQQQQQRLPMGGGPGGERGSLGGPPMTADDYMQVGL